jgi:SAM-dependent methyltransferase
VREVLTSAQRQKQDGVSDREFYSTPRFVTHVDRTFLRQLTELYRQRIPAGSAVLDIGASHISHLPPGVAYKEVVGHGLNATEVRCPPSPRCSVLRARLTWLHPQLARNPALSRFFVRDLNTDPDGWALADQSFDAVTCCVSVQYLQQPERVFCEVYRVLKPGGCAIFAFSTRMFASKAIAAWRDGTSYSRVSLVRSYFQAVRGFSAPELVTSVPLADDTLLDKLWCARAPAVCAVTPARRVDMPV